MKMIANLEISPYQLIMGAVALLFLIEFFHIGYLVGRIRKNTALMSRQLDEVLGKLESPTTGRGPDLLKTL